MLRRLLNQLRAGEFRELAGSHLSVHLSLAESLVNHAIGERLERGAPVRELHVRPADDNRAMVALRLARPGFLPALNIDVRIYQQPSFPTSPVLVLRWSTLPGLAALASVALKFVDVLPPGVKVIGEAVTIDLRVLLTQQHLADLLPFITRAEIHTARGAVLVDLDLRVG